MDMLVLMNLLLLLQKAFDTDQVSDFDGAATLIIAIVEYKHESLKYQLENGAV